MFSRTFRSHSNDLATSNISHIHNHSSIFTLQPWSIFHRPFSTLNTLFSNHQLPTSSSTPQLINQQQFQYSTSQTKSILSIPKRLLSSSQQSHSTLQSKPIPIQSHFKSKSSSIQSHSYRKPIIINSTSKRSITFRSGKNESELPPQQPIQSSTDDLRRFGFKKPQNYNMAQNSNITHPPTNQTLLGRPLPPPGARIETPQQTIKEMFFNDPTIPRWRKDLVRIQDFLTDPARPLTLENDSLLIRIGKLMIRGFFMPTRRLYKFARWLRVKIGSLGTVAFILCGAFIAGIVGTIYFSVQLMSRANMIISRELFVRSCIIDLAARLDDYGLIKTSESAQLLESFQILNKMDEQEQRTWQKIQSQRKSASGIGTDGEYTLPDDQAIHFHNAPKNFKGQEMMKSFILQSMSMPIESARILEAIYDPISRIDEVSEGIQHVLLEKLSDTDPSAASELCPPHIKAIASRYVEDWFKKTRLQMLEEKQKALQRELKVEKIDDLTPHGRQQMKEKIDEFNTGITFDLSKKEKRKLFWKGILTGIMLETGLVGLENETTFLRLAREYAIKGCVLRQIPDKVKLADDEISNLLTTTGNKTEAALITANPAGEFTFSTTEDLKKIRDSLTQQPYSPDHGQIDQRFLQFIFGNEFCREYNISPDMTPYLHQIAPLVLFDLSTWTHPSTIFDLTFNHTPTLLQGSKYTLPPAEYEKVEMYNFMIQEMQKKDTAFQYIDKEYKSSSIARDETIVIPLLAPQDSLRKPSKYGLKTEKTQMALLNGRIPQCYQDTYGAYAKSIFAFDMLILRNYLEISRLKKTLGELGTVRIRDMKIPSTSNYYGNYDQIIQQDLLDVIKHEENLAQAYRKRGLAFKKKYDPRSKTDYAQLNYDPIAYQQQQELERADYIEEDFQELKKKQKSLKRDAMTGKEIVDPHAVSVDARLYKQLTVQPHELSDLSLDNPEQRRLEQEKRLRAKKWIDNGSI